MILLLIILLVWSAPVWAAPKNYLPQSEAPVAARCVNSAGTDYTGCGDMETTLAGEDVLNDVIKVEERYITMPSGGSTPKIAADQLYKTGPGLVKSLTCASDAAATAGTIAVLDSTTAGAGTKIYELDVLAVAYLPFTIELNVPFSVGLYLDFTTTADMQCHMRYR